MASASGCSEFSGELRSVQTQVSLGPVPILGVTVLVAQANPQSEQCSVWTLALPGDTRHSITKTQQSAQLCRYGGWQLPPSPERPRNTVCVRKIRR